MDGLLSLIMVFLGLNGAMILGCEIAQWVDSKIWRWKLALLGIALVAVSTAVLIAYAPDLTVFEVTLIASTIASLGLAPKIAEWTT